LQEIQFLNFSFNSPSPEKFYTHEKFTKEQKVQIGSDLLLIFFRRKEMFLFSFGKYSQEEVKIGERNLAYFRCMFMRLQHRLLKANATLRR
jgi:hypothetical protein